MVFLEKIIIISAIKIWKDWLTIHEKYISSESVAFSAVHSVCEIFRIETGDSACGIEIAAFLENTLYKLT